MSENMIRERRCPKGLVAVVLAAMALVVASCSQDRIGDGVLQRDNVIRFTVSGGTAVQLKSGNDVAEEARYLEPLTLTNEDGTQSLTFQRRSYRTPDSETLDRLCAAGAVTKGTPVTGYNIDSLYGDNLFVTALKGDGSEYIPQQKLVFVSREEGKSESTWTTTSPYYWPGEDLIFWGWAPNGDMADLAVTKTALSFTYTTPDSDGAGTDAEAQSDLIVANTAANLKSGSAKLMFAHALSAIRFEIGNTNDCTIKSISLKGVQSVGECTYTPAAEGTEIVWSNTDVAKDYTQNFGTVIEEYTADDLNPQKVDTTPTECKTFMIIPQDTYTLEVMVECESETVIFSADLTEQGLKPGYTYTYSIDLISTFDFRLLTPSQSSLIYTNTISPETRSVGIVSTKNSTIPVNWKIKSYKIGTDEPVSVDGATFTAGGLTLLNDAGTLKVTALTRAPVDQGTHGYWVNNPARTDDLDWSPADWSNTKAKASSPLDLSKFDFENETDRGTMTTANCYIIRHAGTYKIPLVYGNGIVGGNANTRSYAPTLSGNTQPLTPFVNYLNEGISSPFIENNAKCVPTGCAILWQDEAVVVKDLSIIGDTKAIYDASNVRYLQFTIDPQTVRQNNAIICIYKDLNENSKYDSGEAIWSWLIWTTNNPDLISGAIPVTNHAGNIYNFFPICNLGYVDGENYLTRKRVIVTLEQEETGNTIDITINQPAVLGQFTGNYYQFGRKDPMCRKDTPAAGQFYKKDAPLTDIFVYKAISEPDAFFGCRLYEQASGWYTWAWPHSNLWSGSKATYSTSYENDSEIFKTIYDPSPVGYKVPASKAFTGFTTTGAGTGSPSEYNILDFKNGYYFYTDNTKSDVIMFHASGYRQSETGTITDAGARGSYWSAISGNESSGWQLLFWHGDGSGIVPDNYERRANGQSVRPVKE